MTSDRPIRFGILGTGSILRKYAAAFRLARGVELVAVASRDAGRAQAAAAQFNIPLAHAGYEALLADTGVDAVIVALHNGLHCEWTCRALVAGKHVLCEKPLACSSVEVEQMFATAHRQERRLMEGLMYRFHPQMTLVRQRLPEIGCVIHVSSKRMSHGREPGNPRFDPALGGGALMDIGCYCVDFSRLILGTEPVAATAVAHVSETGVDLTTTATMEFAGNITAQFCCSFEAEPAYAAEIVGTAGRIVIPHPWMPPIWPTEFHVIRNEQLETVRVEPNGVPPHVLVPFVNEIEHFAACIRENRPPTVVTEADSRGNIRAIELIRAAV
jgi:predicted dehydrogenase